MMFNATQKSLNELDQFFLDTEHVEDTPWKQRVKNILEHRVRDFYRRETGSAKESSISRIRKALDDAKVPVYCCRVMEHWRSRCTNGRQITAVRGDNKFVITMNWCPNCGEQQ